MSDWVFYAVRFTTGVVLQDLPLVGFRGTRALTGGSMSATLPLLHLDPDLRRQYLDVTTPGKNSIVAVQDGIVRGEWVLWSRDRSNDLGGVSLSGDEVVSYLDHRVTRAWAWVNTEQFLIAQAMVAQGFNSGAGGPVTISIPAVAGSGQLRDRTYKLADGDIGARLRELSEVDFGFDYLISSSWVTAAAVNTITRTLTLHYPRAGATLPLVFDMAAAGAAPGNAGNVLATGITEDARELACRTYAIGSTEDDVTLLGTYTNLALVTAGYPFLEATRSWSTVEKQATITNYAKSLWAGSQQPVTPTEITVLAGAYPAAGDYGLGDVVTIAIEPAVNFPDGYQQQVRITEITFEPPGSGPETVTLTVTREP